MIKVEQTLFDLMFHGCQDLTIKQADEVYQAIKNDKISGVCLNINDTPIKTLTESLTASDVEKLLTELMNIGNIAIHVEQLEETFSVDDIYDNSSANQQLTILFVGE